MSSALAPPSRFPVGPGPAEQAVQPGAAVEEAVSAATARQRVVGHSAEEEGVRPRRRRPARRIESRRKGCCPRLRLRRGWSRPVSPTSAASSPIPPKRLSSPTPPVKAVVATQTIERVVRPVAQYGIDAIGPRKRVRSARARNECHPTAPKQVSAVAPRLTQLSCYVRGVPPERGPSYSDERVGLQSAQRTIFAWKMAFVSNAVTEPA